MENDAAGRVIAASEFGVWASTPPGPELPCLEGPLECEIGIVGAGYTGLSTALHLGQSGTRCVILEAKEPGWGASGRNTGWLEPNWWLKSPAQMADLFGRERAERLSRWVAGGPALLDNWAGRYSMQIELDRRGMVLATDDPKKLSALEKEAGEWQALGVQHEFLDASAVSRHIATHRYRGGLLLRGGAVLNPLALSRELARACVREGAQIFGRSAVLTIERDGTFWRLRTANGELRCRRLVLATDAYTRNLWPALRDACAMWQLVLIGSEPYAPLEEILPLGTAVGDLDFTNIFTLRRARGGRLVSAIQAPMRTSTSPDAVARPFARKFAKVFPHHPAPRWEHASYGDISLSKTMLPQLCSIGPQAWTAFGYSGTGINLALLLGGELARLAQTDDANSSLYPVTRFEPFKFRGAIAGTLRYVYAPLSRGILSRFN